MQKNRKYIVYALYKGDEYIAQGTLDELSNKTGLKKETLRFYESPVYKRRNKKGNNKVLIKVEE